MPNRRRVPRTARDQRRRELAQNFLVDPEAIEDLVGAARIESADLVVDLGAGRGAITAVLAKRGARVIAVELDPDWASQLERQFRGESRVEVRCADALTTPLPLEPFAVVANLPFNLTSRLVRRILGEGHGFKGGVLLVQREAGMRLSGARQATVQSLAWAPWFDLRIGESIPADAFRPRPSVSAVMLHMTPRSPAWLSPAVFEMYRQFVHACFEARGQTVGAKMRHVLGRQATATALGLASVPANANPGDLSPQDWVRAYRSAETFGAPVSRRQKANRSGGQRAGKRRPET